MRNTSSSFESAVSSIFNAYDALHDASLAGVSLPEEDLTFAIASKSHRTAMSAHKAFLKVFRALDNAFLYTSLSDDELSALWNSDFYEWVRLQWNGNYEFFLSSVHKLQEIIVNDSRNITFFHKPSSYGDTANSRLTGIDASVICAEYKASTGYQMFTFKFTFEELTHTARANYKDELREVLASLRTKYNTLDKVPGGSRKLIDGTADEIKHAIAMLKRNLEAEIDPCSEKQAFCIAKNWGCSFEAAKKLNKYQAMEMIDYSFNGAHNGEEILNHYGKVLASLK